MYIAYFYWHYVVSPKWLLQLLWNFQQAVLQFFSVKILIKTLFAHWRRDALSYRGKSLQEVLSIFALNQISRGIGFAIRMVVLITWVIFELFYLAISTSAFILFLLSPIIATLLVVVGILLLLGL